MSRPHLMVVDLSDGSTEPEEFIALDRHLNDPLLSPDGQWLAFRRNTEIWLAPLEERSIRVEHAHTGAMSDLT